MWTQGLNPKPVFCGTLLLIAATVFSATRVTAQPLSPPSGLPSNLSPNPLNSPDSSNSPNPSPSSPFASFRSDSSPLFENLTLTPDRVGNPTIVRGISGGALSAAQVAERAETSTGSCVGFVDTQPDHVLVLTEAFNGLSLQVQSAEDTTLVIKGPGGSWCNDSYTSANPGIAGQWFPGTYNVWVGSQRSTGYFPYIIRILEIEPPPGTPPIPPFPAATDPDGSSDSPESPSDPSEATPLDLDTDFPSSLPSDLPNDEPNP